MLIADTLVSQDKRLDALKIYREINDVSINSFKISYQLLFKIEKGILFFSEHDILEGSKISSELRNHLNRLRFGHYRKDIDNEVENYI